jgi:hypothetical protein
MLHPVSRWLIRLRSSCMISMWKDSSTNFRMLQFWILKKKKELFTQFRGFYIVTQYIDSVVYNKWLNWIDQSVYYIEHYMFWSWLSIIKCIYMCVCVCTYIYIYIHKYIAIYCWICNQNGSISTLYCNIFMIIYVYTWWWLTMTKTCSVQYNKLIYSIQMYITYNRINVLYDSMGACF